MRTKASRICLPAYRNWRTAVAAGLGLACLVLLHQAATPTTLADRFLPHYSASHPDPCHGWDVYAEEHHDPPGCLRATQLREIQRFRGSAGWVATSHADSSAEKLDQLNQRQLEHLERCVLGMQPCPERPLIVVDYNWATRAEREDWFQGGEGVWSRVIVSGSWCWEW